MRYPRRLFVFGFLLGLLILFPLQPLAADPPAVRVLILPLAIHSEKELAFLHHGVVDMLAARIGQSAEVIRQASLDPPQEPVQAGRDRLADYVVSGSLTVFDDRVSTDVMLTAVDTGAVALHFSRLGRSGGDILSHIDAFATQVNQYLASISAGDSGALLQPRAKVPPIGPADDAAVTPPPAVVSVPVAPTPAAATVDAALSSPVAPLPGPWTSDAFKGTVSALASGDVDGDGRVDIVFLHENQVVVKQWNGDQLDRMTAFDAGKGHLVIALDVGDINANGMAEIFVTRLDAHRRLDGVVLEWNGAGLQPIATGQPWYFRVGTDSEKGLVLMGQRRGAATSDPSGGLYADAHFLPGIFEMTWAGDAYEPGRRLPVPPGLDIYRFARGDVLNDGRTLTIAYASNNALRVYDPTGAVQWAGDETYGGNPIFLEAASATDVRTRDRTYLAQRLWVADLGGDGRFEVATVHNRDAARGLVERYRRYTRGRLVVLRWQHTQMREIWSGEPTSGYISDFSLADLNGDGRLEAVYAMVTGIGLTQAPTSYIVIEPIDDRSAP